MVSLTPKLALAILAFCAATQAVPVVNKRANHPVTLPLQKQGYSALEGCDTWKCACDKRGAVYTIPVKIGSTTFQVIADTGSGFLWVGAGTNVYLADSTTVSDSSSFDIGYGSGYVEGNVFNDTVTIGGVAVTNTPFGNATFHSGPYSGSDGIIGLGPHDLTANVVDSGPLVNGFPTPLEAMSTQLGLPQVLGIYFKPESGSDDDDVNGEITFGGTDPSKYTGSISYSPITTAGLYDDYWSVDVASITVGSTTIQSATHPALVDTGSTLTILPYDVYQNYLTATGGTQGPYGFTRYTTPPTESITFSIGGTDFVLSPAEYLIPADQLTYYGDDLDPSYTYSWIQNGGPDDGLFAVTFIFSQKFLENFYTVLDGTNSQIGFATRV